jgi:hypothetical protein
MRGYTRVHSHTLWLTPWEGASHGEAPHTSLPAAALRAADVAQTLHGLRRAASMHGAVLRPWPPRTGAPGTPSCSQGITGLPHSA